ncbi:MAG: FAD-dependent oxidoreductase, partial [Lachnospiraceae bacterium]|nr:FAD-dependent oxidoreductase [Lachnospiraceae bacterium]
MILDVAIIGAGPAGLTAAIYGKRAGLNLLVIENNPVSGGQVATTYEVDNYPGLPGIGGMELGGHFHEHAVKMGAEFLSGTVKSVDKTEEGFTLCVETEEADVTLQAKAVILATGAEHAKLGIPGEEELAGAGVSYCATCDGAFFNGMEVAVAGGGDVAVEDAIFLARSCSKVYLIHRRDSLRAADRLQKQLFALPNV